MIYIGQSGRALVVDVAHGRIEVNCPCVGCVTGTY